MLLEAIGDLQNTAWATGCHGLGRRSNDRLALGFIDRHGRSIVVDIEGATHTAAAVSALHFDKFHTGSASQQFSGLFRYSART